LTPWTTLTGAGALVVDDGRLPLVRQRRPYGVHGDAKSRPQVEEDRTQSYAVRP
jgi:hypothetical protein